ncbi:hypothetical protein [Nitrosarchaeum sp. AC2]|uniref:hypothetical protein n=1 Tax=Nitrosarchaeum sp. AC2 TaxID=2259673 RepID=UPI0015C799EF|nr:hypothetical protein [Nitrosarchaeum sp. AC2]QLH11235.1 hypothetical protein DSQ20_07020 [Nitrosarchaeum sp. AC2]
MDAIIGRSPIVNADVLIRLLKREDTKELKQKLRSYLTEPLNAFLSESCIITDQILNEVTVEAKHHGISRESIITTLYPPYSSYFHIVYVDSECIKRSVDSIKEYPDYDLSLSEWSTIWFMSKNNCTTLISGNSDFDRVFSNAQLQSQFASIKRV